MSSKSLLIKSATEMFLKYGIKSVSMDDIARLIGISKKTIYNYVTNKKDLVQTVIEIFIKEEQKAVKKIVKESTNALDEMTSIASHVMESLRMMKPSLTFDLQKYHPEAWRFVENNHMTFMETTIQKNLRRGKKEGLYRDDLEENIVSKIYLAMAIAITNEDIFSSKEFKLPEIYETFVRYHLNGIINDNGRKELSKYLKRTAA